MSFGETMNEFEYITKLLEIGDVEGAITELHQLLKDNPDNIEAWFLLANTLNDNEKIKDCYRKIIRIDLNNQRATEKLQKLIIVSQKEKHPTGEVYQPFDATKKDANFFSLGKRYISAIIGTIIIITIVIIWFNYEDSFTSIPDQSQVISTPTLYVSSAECKGEISKEWADTVIQRQNELNSDLDELIATKPTNPDDYIIYSQRALIRYNAQRSQETPVCLMKLHKLITDAFYYNWKSLEAATLGDWSQSASYGQTMTDLLDEAQSESFHLDDYLFSDDKLTSNPEADSEIPTRTKSPPVRTPLPPLYTKSGLSYSPSLKDMPDGFEIGLINTSGTLVDEFTRLRIGTFSVTSYTNPEAVKEKEVYGLVINIDVLDNLEKAKDLYQNMVTKSSAVPIQDVLVPVDKAAVTYDWEDYLNRVQYLFLKNNVVIDISCSGVEVGMNVLSDDCQKIYTQIVLDKLEK